MPNNKPIPTDNQWINVNTTTETAKQVFLAVFIDSYENGDPEENGLYKEIAAKFGEITKLMYRLRNHQEQEKIARALAEAELAEAEAEAKAKVGDNTNES